MSAVQEELQRLNARLFEANCSDEEKEQQLVKARDDIAKLTVQVEELETREESVQREISILNENVKQVTRQAETELKQAEEQLKVVIECGAEKDRRIEAYIATSRDDLGRKVAAVMEGIRIEMLRLNDGLEASFSETDALGRKNEEVTEELKQMQEMLRNSSEVNVRLDEVSARLEEVTGELVLARESNATLTAVVEQKSEEVVGLKENVAEMLSRNEVKSLSQILL